MKYKDLVNGERQYQFVEKYHFPRPAGSEAEKKTAEGIFSELLELFPDPVIEPFEFMSSQIVDQRLLITEPYEREYQIIAYKGCRNTLEDGVQAPFYYMQDTDPVSLLNASKKIVMVNQRITGKTYQKLMEADVAGFLSISGTPIQSGVDALPEHLQMPKGKYDLSGGSLHYKDALELITLGAESARLITRQEQVKKTSQNVRVRIEGSEYPQQVLTVSAHYDSVAWGPGAYDNLSGASVVMELARYFSNHRPKRTLEFVWFGAEEEGLLGSQAYLEQHKEEQNQHLFHMNIDLCGQAIGADKIGITAGEDARAVIAGILCTEGICAVAESRICGSDSNSFAWNHIPAMTINRDGFGMHTHYDQIALISPQALRNSALLLGTIAEHLGNAMVFPFERTVPKEFITQLDGYFSVK